MRVSIIVPCYNQGVYIEECLDSIKAQTFKDWECIIVDDGSTDDSYSTIKTLTENDERFRILQQENRGVSSARNFAIKNAKGMYILPLDADDKIEKNYIENCIEKFTTNVHLQLVYGLAFSFGKKNGILFMEPFRWERLLMRNMIHCSGMFRRKDWEITGGYDESMLSGLEDWEFWINLLKSNQTVYRINEVGLHYRIKLESRNNSINESDITKIRQYVSYKHMDSYNELIGDLPTFLLNNQQNGSMSVKNKIVNILQILGK